VQIYIYFQFRNQVIFEEYIEDNIYIDNSRELSIVFNNYISKTKKNANINEQYKD
jgi:hypothetical protein